MPPDLQGSFGSFPEAETYFRQKVNMPSRRWDDLWQGQHTRAFMVAGVTRESILTDIRSAVDAAISQGETLDDFRARFRDMVKKYGWPGGAGGDSEAGFNWRTSVIYHTNLRTAYQAGRWDTLKNFPYLQYHHSHAVVVPRMDHVAWDGKILATNDPWWNTHYPPNGWGCRCTVTGISAARLKALGMNGPDDAPATVDGDPPPEWAYNVGVANSGPPAVEPKQKPQWVDLTPGDWESYDLPAVLPSRPTLGEPLRNVDTQEELANTLTQMWGGDTKQYTLRADDGFTYPVQIDAEGLAEHLTPDKRPFAGYLDDVLDDPDEIWLAFMRDETTGKIALRSRVIRAIDVEGRVMFMALDASKGRFEDITMYPRESKRAGNMRQGKLIYARK